MAERRREFVIREIERAGMQLIAERGYDSVTIADIAEASGVSRRTFFRHFSSKADMMDAYSLRLNRRVVAALVRRPADEPVAVAVVNAILATAEMTDEEQASARLRSKALHQTRGDQYTMGSPNTDEELVRMLADRLQVDPLTDLRPRLLAWTTLAAAQAAVKTWVEREDDSRMIDHLHEAFDYLLKGLHLL